MRNVTPPMDQPDDTIPDRRKRQPTIYDSSFL